MGRPVVVVGAGLAGVVAARTLASAGREVVILEKSRGFGGRLATRRAPDAIGGAWDHGAAFLRVREPGFAALLRPAVDRGELVPWAERLARPTPSGLQQEPLTEAVRRLAAPGGSSGVVKGLAQGLDVRRDVRVTQLEQAGDAWIVRTVAGEADPAEWRASAVVLAIPAPQVLALVRPLGTRFETLAATLADVSFHPCLVGLFAFEGPAPAVRAVQCDAGPVSWIGVESSKRASSRVLLAVHGSPAWSRAAFEVEEREALAVLWKAVREAGLGVPESPDVAQLKRWRYARPDVLAPAHALVGEGTGPLLVACGDWCVAPRVEGAYVSGRAAAEALLARSAPGGVDGVGL